MKNIDYIGAFDRAIKDLFNDAWRGSWRDPARVLFFLKTLRWQKRTARIRQNELEKSVTVPAVLIISVTDRCNLRDLTG